MERKSIAFAADEPARRPEYRFDHVSEGTTMQASGPNNNVT